MDSSNFSLLNKSPVPLLIVDSELTILFHNSALIHLTKDKANSIHKHYLFDYFTPVDKSVSAVQQEIEQCEQNTCSVYCYLFDIDEIYRLNLTREQAQDKYWVTV